MNLLATILTAPLRRPWVAIGAALLCALLALLACSRIHADASLAAMFSRDNPAAQALTRVLSDFGAVDDLIVMASVAGDGEASPAEIERLLAFGARLQTEVAVAPETSALAESASFKPDAEFRSYVERVLAPGAVHFLDDASYAAARHRLTRPQMVEQIRQDEAMMTAPGAAGALAKGLMRDPLRLREFLGVFLHRMEAMRPFKGREGADSYLSQDGRNLLIFVRGKQGPSDLEFCKALTHGVSDAADRANTDKLELRYAGSYAIAAASATAIKRDMIESIVGSVLGLQLLFILAYRSPLKLFALAFGPIALGVLLGFGGYAMLGVGLTPMTGVLGGILAGMAIDYSIQYLSMYESRRDAAETPFLAAKASALGITPAAFAAWATSIIGFIAIGASSVKALRDFAILGSLGLTGAFLAKTALLPMVLMSTDRRARENPGKPWRSSFRLNVEPLLNWIGRHCGRLIVLSLAVFAITLGLLAFLPGEVLSMESDLTVMHPRPNAAIEAQNLIAQRFGMHDWLLVHLSADSPEKLVALAHRVDTRLASDTAKGAGVVGSFGLASLLPDPAAVAARQKSLGAAEADRTLADFRGVIADSAFNPDAVEIRDYESFLRVVLTQPPPTISTLIAYPKMASLMLPRTALRGHLPTEAITMVFVSGSTDERASRDRAVVGARAALAGETGATLTGLSVLSHDTETTVRRDLPKLIGVAVVIVLLFLLAYFRNVAEAILSMAPTVFSLAVLLAAMRLAGQKLNMVNLIAAPLLIGIDVDYGIFLVALTRVKHARGMSREDLSRRVAPVSHAVVMCAAATIVGFGSLMWTSVPAVRSLGFAVAVGIGACLFCVLFLLTPMFFWMAQRRAETGQSE